MNRKRIAAVIPAAGIALSALAVAPAFAGGSSYGGGSGSPHTEPLQIRKVDATDGKLIGANTTAYHTTDRGANFNGQSCSRGVDDLNWNCENLRDYMWFRDGLPENGTTNSSITDEIPMVSGDDLQEISASESVAPTGYQRIMGTATVKMTASGRWDVVGTLPDGVTLTHSNGYAYLTWHDVTTPVIHPTPVVTHVPAVTTTTTTPAHHVALVQLDTYHDAYGKRPMTKAQIAQREAARKSDKARGTLIYRQGSASPTLWGSTTSTITSMDVCAMPKLASNQDAWVLGNGATAALPWGASHKLAQVAPSAINCNPVTTTVVVTPAHDVTTYQCPDGTAATSADAYCEPKNPGGGIGGSYGG